MTAYPTKDHRELGPNPASRQQGIQLKNLLDTPPPPNPRHTCEVVKAVMLEDLIQDAEKLPHLGRDGLTGEAECQRQDLLIELCGGREGTVSECKAGIRVMIPLSGRKTCCYRKLIRK